MQPQYGAVKLRCLLAIATKPGIIKLNLYEVLEVSKQEPLLVLRQDFRIETPTFHLPIRVSLQSFSVSLLHIYVNDLPSNAAML